MFPRGKPCKIQQKKKQSLWYSQLGAGSLQRRRYHSKSGVTHVAIAVRYDGRAFQTIEVVKSMVAGLWLQ